jgi:hypothetical protein
MSTVSDAWDQVWHVTADAMAGYVAIGVRLRVAAIRHQRDELV